MDWLYGEPTLDDMLSDPTIHAVMDRDGIDAETLRALLRDIRRTEPVSPSLAIAA
ncbi:MAG: hypothetical protein JWL84_5331 [Rhodospirillales bacterium]|jgi:hypothetical protein|nr:hypothetical protein [Rhodospirillales bacterium]